MTLAAGGSSTLVYDGTAGNDAFFVAPTTSAISLNGQLTLTPTGISTLTLSDPSGDNTYTVDAPVLTGLTTINIQGSGLADPDVVNLNGNGTAVTANLGTDTPSVTGGGLGTVDVSGVGVVNLQRCRRHRHGHGHLRADTLAVTPTSTTTATVQDYLGGTAQNGQGGTLASLTATGPASQRHACQCRGRRLHHQRQRRQRHAVR